MIEPMFGNDRLDVGGRTMDGNETLVFDVLIEEFDEIGVGVDRDQLGVRSQPVQDRAGEGPDAGAIFDEQPRPFPIDRLQHLLDEDPHWKPHMMFYFDRSMPAVTWGVGDMTAPVIDGSAGDRTLPVQVLLIPVPQWSDGKPVGHR